MPYTPETPALRSARAVAAWVRACLADIGAAVRADNEHTITVKYLHHAFTLHLRPGGWYADPIPDAIRAAYTPDDWRRTERWITPIHVERFYSAPEPPVEWSAQVTQ